MNRWIVLFIIFFLSSQFILNLTVYADMCLHNERSKCTQARSEDEITQAEHDQCHHLCIKTGHASGYCSLLSNCFQYCSCKEKEL